MRHGKKINHLGRTSSHRKAMLSNMASSLILHKRINTTTAKAKALKTYVEPLITKAKKDNTHSRRVVFSYLQNKHAVAELFRDVAEKIGERPGGYTRILKTGNRQGDDAEMCLLELVDYNENYTTTDKKQAGTSRKRRRRRGGKKKTQPQTAETTKQQTADNQQEEPENKSDNDSNQPIEENNTQVAANKDKQEEARHEEQDENRSAENTPEDQGDSSEKQNPDRENKQEN